ncbi:M56 family metallopeptidase [Chryseobacterium sp. Alg-005]|uniref:M56 family metallopeptidase n=1 Tax=Chryseobacterium sp. Alg-005 TaxID=3159516 RepID=UPI0036F2FED8
MHVFNRFYLLFSLVFSYTAPFISITAELPEMTANPLLVLETKSQEIMVFPIRRETFDWMDLVWIVYGIVTLILLIKTIISFLTIINLKGKKLNYQGINIFLTKENLSPFSFWNTIYLGENYWLNNRIDPRILLHEKGHLDQKHSLDILLVEFLKIFSWFNPAIYIYKKAMIANHEFLADAAVLKENFNVKEYQNLILQEIISSQKYNLTHSFHFNNIKKRFIMMTSKKSKFTVYKKLVSIPVFVIAFSIFVQKTYAHTVSPQPDKNSNIQDSYKHQNISPSNKYKEFKSVQKDEPSKMMTKFEDFGKDTSSQMKNTNEEEPYQSQSSFDTTPSPTEFQDDTAPEYPGGNQQLRTKMATFFDASKISIVSKEKYKSEINFTVDETGKVMDVQAEGPNEAFNAEAKSSFLKANEGIIWKPATKEGKAVRNRMKIPLVMSFD